jgi:hypothetical protein
MACAVTRAPVPGLWPCTLPVGTTQQAWLQGWSCRRDSRARLHAGAGCKHEHDSRASRRCKPPRAPGRRPAGFQNPSAHHPPCARGTPGWRRESSASRSARSRSTCPWRAQSGRAWQAVHTWQTPAAGASAEPRSATWGPHSMVEHGDAAGSTWLENMRWVGPSNGGGGARAGVTLSVWRALQPPAGRASTCQARDRPEGQRQPLSS